MRIDWVEGFGFCAEVTLFVLAGVFLFINIYISLSLYITGLITAYFVGQRIIKKVIKRIKEDG